MKKFRLAIIALLLVAAIALMAGCDKDADSKKAPITAFKTGTWASEFGVNYVFYNDGVSGSNISVADGMGIGFTYELSEDGSCVFHMGSVDDVTKATVEFIAGGDDTAAITWEDGSKIVLFFVSEDTSDEFAGTYTIGEITANVDSPEPEAFVGNWHDSVAGRASMTVTLVDGNPYFEVTWSDSAFAYYVLNFLCDGVDDEGRLTYDSGFKGRVEVDADGVETKTIIDEAASGTVELKSDGTMVWIEADAADAPHEFVKD